MKSAIVKRSIVLAKHKTSVSLEDEFWQGLHQIAASQNKSMAAVVERIDAGRAHNNLSSAIRIFVFNHFRSRAARKS